MNKLIYRKLSLDILVFFLLFSSALTTIIWVIQGVNLLDIVSEDGHGIKIYFFYSILNIPKIFSKIFIFTIFLTLFVVISRYEDNNEILIFWTNGIKKISFINFIGKFSLFFVLIQLLLNLIIVPYTQNLGQEYLKNSSIEFFPKLLQEKKFSNLMSNLTIFVEKYDSNGILKGIYIKEKISNDENKIIIASKGELIKNKEGYNFKLTDGKIINFDKKGSINFGFKETIYELSKFSSKTRKEKKLDETSSILLFNCLNKFLKNRKDNNLRCGGENNNAFLLKDIYGEVFKRVVNPIYIIIISLISSLVILKSKINKFQNYYKLFLFLSAFLIIIFSELSYKLLYFPNLLEIISLILPILFIISFYFYVLIKSKFNFYYL